MPVQPMPLHPPPASAGCHTSRRGRRHGGPSPPTGHPEFFQGNSENRCQALPVIDIRVTGTRLHLTEELLGNPHRTRDSSLAQPDGQTILTHNIANIADTASLDFTPQPRGSMLPRAALACPR